MLHVPEIVSAEDVMLVEGLKLELYIRYNSILCKWIAFVEVLKFNTGQAMVAAPFVERFWEGFIRAL